jgi:hypothetical protein
MLYFFISMIFRIGLCLEGSALKPVLAVKNQIGYSMIVIYIILGIIAGFLLLAILWNTKNPILFFIMLVAFLLLLFGQRD